MNPPQLAPPGAGLPFLENLIARCLLGLKRLTKNSADLTAHFISERAAIAELIGSVDENTLSRRVLIQRPRGLEDSSRNWSILMTLDHLRIVNHAFIGAIGSLANEHVPEGEASTAAVKPDPAVGLAVIGEYEVSCDALLETLAAVKNFKTQARYAHPWFGQMDAHGWHALTGSHMSIHRTQIDRILGGTLTRS
ncbi:MAG: DinB family protein [Verrucomicrobiota bacterium]